jgi:glycerol-3-phosphate dehydrogenase
LSARSPSEDVYDVAIVGAGDVGSAIARELARFELRVALIEAGPDVGAGTSKANTAILHTGYDAKPGTLEARLVARGHDLLLSYSEEVGIPIERTGALLVAWTEEEHERFGTIRENAERCGYDRVADVSAEELYRREPHLGPGARGALEIPDEHIVCPFTPPLAYSTQAVLAGVDLRRSEAVTGLRRQDGRWLVDTTQGGLTTMWVVNAAGLHSDDVHRMAGHEGFTVTPRRGELIVYDKLARRLIGHTILPVPTATTKGVLVAPTVFGNVMLGPTAVDIERKDDTGSTAEGLAYLRSLAGRLMPELARHEVTAIYVGLRAATEHGDYVIGVDGGDRYAWAGGIRSTGSLRRWRSPSTCAMSSTARDWRCGSAPASCRASGCPTSARLGHAPSSSPRRSPPIRSTAASSASASASRAARSAMPRAAPSRRTTWTGCGGERGR